MLLIFSLILTFIPSEYLLLAIDDRVEAKGYTEITVQGTSDATPGVEWGQVDDGRFRALVNGSYQYTSNANPTSRNNPVPTPRAIQDRIDMRNYKMPDVFEDPLTGKEYPASQVSEKKLDSRNGGVSFNPIRNGSWYKGENIRVDGDYHVSIYTTTGQGYAHQEKFVYTGSNGQPLLRPNGWEKYAYRYHIPLKVTWVGVIRIYDDDLTLKASSLNACIGESITITPTLFKTDGSQHDVGSHPNFSYSFATGGELVSSIVSGNSIIVTGKAEGTVGFIGRFVDSSQNLNLTEDTTFKFIDCDGTTIPGPDPDPEEPEDEIDDPGPPPIPPADTSCRINTNVNPGQTMGENNLSVDPEGKIWESSESNQFDVLKYGIPSSEYLQVLGLSEKYVTDYIYRQMNGTATYDFKVTKDYLYRWEEVTTKDDGGKLTTVYYEHRRNEQSFQDAYPLSYWLIGHLNVYGLNEVIFKNYALPGEKLSLTPSSKVNASGSHDPNQNAHVFPKNCNGIHLNVEHIDGRPPSSGPNENLSSHANLGSRQPDVKNDRVQVDGNVSMDDGRVVGNGPPPTPIPAGPLIEVSKSSLLIDPLKVNKWQTESSIQAFYRTEFQINSTAGSFSETGYSPDKINTVTVHTPVVMYAEASDDKEHDQRVNPPERSTPADPDNDRHAFVLDRPFEVKLPTSGQHLDESIAPGYGNRDFEKYVRKDVDGQAYHELKFPFDVYTETKQGFYPKETWIKIPTTIETVDFFLPVWVPEGEYEVKFRSVAINSPDSIPEEQQEEPKANLNLEYRTPNEVMDKHIAVSTIKVDVIGRLYDFRVTDILDFRWGPVFRTTEGLIEHTGNHYWVGDKMIDGDLRGNDEPFVLPVRHGSHPKSPEEMKNVAVKTGYQFKFDMKSKGNMWNSDDAVRITPSFHFVNKDGTNRRPVDVYYHDDANYFVQIGSKKDRQYREVTLNQPLRNVEEKQLFDTAQFMYRHPDEFGYRDAVNNVSEASFIRKYNRNYSKKKTTTGPYGWQILNWNLRTLIGPEASDVPGNAMVPPVDAIAREQKWFGEYSLPAEIFVADKGRNIAGYGPEHRLTKNSPVFLQDGYIIVNFDIETIDQGDTDNPHLSYHKGPLANQWKKEGFKYNFIDPYGDNFNLIDGDVIFYHGDQSSYDDFNSNVTH